MFRCSRCCSIHSDSINISLKYTTTNGRSENIEVIASVNVNGDLFHWYLSHGRMKAVLWRSITGMWKYPFCRSNTLNTLAPLTFTKRSSRLKLEMFFELFLTSDNLQLLLSFRFSLKSAQLVMQAENLIFL